MYPNHVLQQFLLIVEYNLLIPGGGGGGGGGGEKGGHIALLFLFKVVRTNIDAIGGPLYLMIRAPPPCEHGSSHDGYF